jgi:hypothetical protein
MHDEFRLRAHLSSPPALVDALNDLQLDDAARSDVGRLAVTHDDDDVFLYADSLAAAEHARAVVAQAISEHGLGGEVTLSRWHPLEERWEDAAAPLPASAEEEAVERARRDAAEDAESAAYGAPEWEVRMTLPSHRHAREFAARLRSEAIPVSQHWRHLLVGANDEDEAAALAERLRGEAPPGSEIVADANGMPFWEEQHPFALFGGLGN